MHDTPEKRLFANEVRTFSHGCVRVDSAMRIADFLLENDSNEYTIDSVKTWIDSRKMKRINLNIPFPIYLHYFTCAADSLKNIFFYPDIYGYDELMKNAMFEPEERSELLSSN